ncbi:hypothetical protein WN55_02845 [Dufourea novaeangliae]|uniref:Uncharacterized protein n=1 Tax=Dufourea novaeangliae TaxID=178035 RepID=A0A154PIA2_DUFNO|nr:hypothetical protein WN55_02845 [Dufourea novaeangliae]
MGCSNGEETDVYSKCKTMLVRKYGRINGRESKTVRENENEKVYLVCRMNATF